MFRIDTMFTRLAAAALLLILQSLSMSSEVHAQDRSIECRPIGVMSFPNRIHVQCATAPEPGIVYFAMGTNDARLVSRTLALMSAAQVGGMSLNIVTDFRDRSGVNIGCLAHDCRLIKAIGIASPPPPLPAPPISDMVTPQSGEFVTSDSDRIRWEVKRNAVAPDRAVVEICLGPGITWEKRLKLTPALSTFPEMAVLDNRRCAERPILTGQLRNDQLLTFNKQGFTLGLVEWKQVQQLSLGGYGLTGGSRLTFTWLQDSGALPTAPTPSLSGERTGGFRTNDGDLIHYRIIPNVEASNTVVFQLCQALGLNWIKRMNLPDGIGNSWDIVIQDQVRCAQNSLWAWQVTNGQELTFSKGKMFGVLTRVHTLPLTGIGQLPGGSRVVFDWIKD